MNIGSLFSGYRGLDMAVEQFFGAETVWWSDIDPGAIRINEHHWPDQPNLGDITTVDWSQVEPVDILTGGFPCQDLSHAGKRAGMHDGTRSGLWSHMATAIDQLRPRYVIAENVRGLLSASATSDLEPCPWCLGGAADGEPALRALGCVLGDLAELGYDTRWVGLRAADVGAPHGRFRIFIMAADTRREHGERGATEIRSLAGVGPASSEPERSTSPAANTRRNARRTGRLAAPGQADSGRSHGEPAGRGRASAFNADSAGRERGGGQEQNGWAEPARADLTPADPTGDGWDEGWPEPARLIGGPDATERGASDELYCANCDAGPLGGDHWSLAAWCAHRVHAYCTVCEGRGRPINADPCHDPAPADASGERHGRREDGRALGLLDGDAEGEARQWERARAKPGDRGAQSSDSPSRAGRPPERIMGYLDHDAASQAGPDQVLRDMRSVDDPQVLRGEQDAGGHGTVPESPQLLAELREHEEDSHERRPSLAGQEAQAVGVQRVRVNDRPARTPQGPEPSEQRAGEPDNALLFLPPKTALAGGPGEAHGRCGEGQGYGCSAWGQYSQAVHRWEIRLGRLAPSPTETSPRGSQRLSARAVEFLMGLPAGHVTDVPGLGRNAQLKALGNGVVPQQAYAALQMLTASQEAVA